MSALHHVCLLAPGDGEENSDDTGKCEDKREGEGWVDALKATVDVVRAQCDAGDGAEHAEASGDPDGTVA